MGTEMASSAVKLGTIDPPPVAIDRIYALDGLSEAAPGLSLELEETLGEYENAEHHGSAVVGLVWALGLEAAVALLGYGIWLLCRLW
jgi:hypothetical protein